MASVTEAIGALKYLEGKLGTHPSVDDVAEEMGVSPRTANLYLKQAVREGVIVQHEGRYMTHAVAQAFEAQKEKKGK